MLDDVQFADDFSGPTLGRFYSVRPGVGEITRRDDGLHYRIIAAHGPPSSLDSTSIDYLGRPQPHTAQVHLLFESTCWTVEMAIDYDFDLETNGRAACAWIVLGFPEERYKRSIEFVRYADLPPSSHGLSVTVRSSSKEPIQTQLTDQPHRSNWYRISRSDQDMEAQWSEDGQTFATVLKWHEPNASVVQSVLLNGASFAGGASFTLNSLRIRGAHPGEGYQRPTAFSMAGTQRIAAEVSADDVVAAIRAGRDVKLVRCSIVGSLNLASVGAEITSNVRFENCDVPDRLHSAGITTVAGQFTFIGCRFGELGLSKVRFRQPFAAVSCQFVGDTRFIGTEFGCGADFSFSSFQQRPFFRILRCRRSLSLYYSDFMSGGDFSEMQIGEDLSISDVDLKSGTLTFRQSRVAGTVRFLATLQRDPPPRLVGAVDFSNAIIGQLIISSGDPHGDNEYTGPPRWDLAADVFLRETQIRALVLRKVSFLGTLDCSGARKTIQAVDKKAVGVAKLIGGWPITQEFHSCFISHSTRDAAFVQRLHDVLTENGVECWFAPETLKIGDQFPKSIKEALNKVDKLLLVLSADSIKSDWVRREVEICLERERDQSGLIVCPIQLDDSITKPVEQWVTLIVEQRHTGDFRGWVNPERFEREVGRLLVDLRRHDR